MVELTPVWEYVRKISWFHEFTEFNSDDLLGVANSALQAVLLANNDESVFLNFIEPVFGTKMKSPVETFLHRNNGPGNTTCIYRTSLKKYTLFIAFLIITFFFSRFGFYYGKSIK